MKENLTIKSQEQKDSINLSFQDSDNSINSITIPENITEIAKATFYGHSDLITVTIPNNIVSIGDFVFCGCTNLYFL